MQAAKPPLLLLRSVPCTRVQLADAIPDTDALNDACAWLDQRPPPEPQPQPRAERTPAPLGTLLGAPPPPLEALCGPAPLCACPERLPLVLGDARRTRAAPALHPRCTRAAPALSPPAARTRPPLSPGLRSGQPAHTTRDRRATD